MSSKQTNFSSMPCFLSEWSPEGVTHRWSGLTSLRKSTNIAEIWQPLIDDIDWSGEGEGEGGGRGERYYFEHYFMIMVLVIFPINLNMNINSCYAVA